MTPERKEEHTESIERLTDVIYSAGMDEESDELREIYGELLTALKQTEDKLTEREWMLKDTLDTATKLGSRLEETEQQLVSQTNKLTQAEQTIARQREAIDRASDMMNHKHPAYRLLQDALLPSGEDRP